MFDERRRLSSREKKNRSVSLSLSPLLFFFWLCFFWLSFLSLEVFLSHQEACLVSLSPAILMNLREVFRERHFAAQKRARAREKRQTEREKETRERARAQTNTLYRRKFLSFALSLRHYREELTTTQKTEYSFLSENRKLACFPWETIIMKTKRRSKNHRRR